MLLLLSACATSPSGVWMFRLAVEPVPDDACAVSVSHNLEDAETPDEDEDESDWEEEAEATFSEQVFFGLIEDSGDGAVLVLGDLAWPGTGEKGSWTFSWTTESWDQTRTTHASGYQFEHSQDQTVITELVGTFDGDAMTGEWHEQTELYDSWLESDLWSEEAAEVVGENGEMPVGTYLETEEWVETKKGGKEKVVAASNTREGEECSSESCTLSVSDACSWQFQLTGERTGLDAADFDSVSGAGQASGGA